MTAPHSQHRDAAAKIRVLSLALIMGFFSYMFQLNFPVPWYSHAYYLGLAVVCLSSVAVHCMEHDRWRTERPLWRPILCAVSLAGGATLIILFVYYLNKWTVVEAGQRWATGMNNNWTSLTPRAQAAIAKHGPLSSYELMTGLNGFESPESVKGIWNVNSVATGQAVLVGVYLTGVCLMSIGVQLAAVVTSSVRDYVESLIEPLLDLVRSR